MQASNLPNKDAMSVCKQINGDETPNAGTVTNIANDNLEDAFSLMQCAIKTLRAKLRGSKVHRLSQHETD